MARLLFDIEANGFLDTVTKVHCLTIMDIDTGEISQFGPDKSSLNEGYSMLWVADEVIGHNIIKYDLPVLDKLRAFNFSNWTAKITDTLVMSRLLYSDMVDSDLKLSRERLPGKYIGQHSLEAWGYRLGVFKSEYTGGWEEWNQEMHDYNRQDVVANKALYDRLIRMPMAETAWWVETRFAQIIAEMERNGFGFNFAAAGRLYSMLVGKRSKLELQLKQAFPPKEVTEIFIPKVNNKTRGYVKGVPFLKKWTVEFNPSSRQHIAERLIELGWKPSEFTPTGQPKVDEETLSGLPYPEAALLAEYFLVEKRIGQIAEGDQAWLKLMREGRIHGSVNTNGAVTGRCTHSNPNIAQVPKVGSPYGAECRALFGPRPGWALVGSDLSGLELRCLAHFMARYDGGKYGEILLKGDIHWANVQAMGLTLDPRDEHNLAHKIYRDKAKTFIYAFLYGAGDHKIGTIVYDIVLSLKQAGLPYEHLQRKFFGAVEVPADEDLKKAGRKLKRNFMKKLPALGKLVEAVQQKVKEKGYLIGLDGRKLHIRSQHAALNSLLQSAGALISKVWIIKLYDNLSSRGWVHLKHWALCAHVHDEKQAETTEDRADELGRISLGSMREAGEFFNFRIPIDGEFKVGRNWCETH